MVNSKFSSWPNISWHPVQSGPGKKWILPLMIMLNETENSPVRIHLRLDEDTLALIEVHAHKATIKIDDENTEESGFIPHWLKPGFTTGMWVRVRQKKDKWEIAVMVAGDLEWKESLVEAE